jgi:formylglycine-generating enzyme required for sulfatase activity
VQEAKVVMPEKKAGSPPSATTQQWVNSLGMEFVAVPGVKGLICVHETRVQDYQGFAKDKDLAWDPVAGQTGDHPAVNVFWTEARQFCAWLTAKERQAGTISAAQTYRLPTDLEWSAAVGMSPEKGKDPAERSKTAQYGGGPAARPWTVPWNAEDGFTADQPPKAEAGNYHASVGVDKFTNTSPVRTFKPNRFGLYDLGGNAWEWCEDEFTKGGGTYVMRGGSWKTEMEKPSRDPFTRNIIAPGIFKMLSGYRFPGAIAQPDTGFRIVLDAGQ